MSDNEIFTLVVGAPLALVGFGFLLHTVMEGVAQRHRRERVERAMRPRSECAVGIRTESIVLPFPSPPSPPEEKEPDA